MRGVSRWGAGRCWEQIRARVISEACAGRPGEITLQPLALVRGEPEARARLERLSVAAEAEAAAAAARGRGAEAALARARRASVLDLQGRHEEALGLLEGELLAGGGASASASRAATPPPPGLAAAARLLRELATRHLALQAERRATAAAGGSGGHGRLPAQAIEVLDGAAASAAEVAERFVVPGRPCVLRNGGVAPAWGPEELRARLGSQKVPLRRRRGASAEWARLEFVGVEAFDRFLDVHVERGPRAKDAPQLFDFSIWQSCADELGSQVVMPRWFSVDLYSRATGRVHPVSGSSSPTLFLAAAGTASALHVDFLQTHFWMAMCSGRKRWRVVPREDLPLLRPLYLTDLNPSFPADLDEAGEAVRVSEVMLEAGDLIFIPRGWPHEVSNEETSVAISANFIDASNVAASRQEAELLGLVNEDPALIAAELRSYEASGLASPAAAAASAPAGAASGAAGHEPLRDFKARHGEPRAPHETQQRVMRWAALAVGTALCAVGCAARWAL